jgi:ABC-type glycerol-3-phosphate transport system permease component
MISYMRQQNRMDGHGETSIPPYNFVVGGIMTSLIVTVIRAVLSTFCSIHTSYNQIAYKTQLQRKTQS